MKSQIVKVYNEFIFNIFPQLIYIIIHGNWSNYIDIDTKGSKSGNSVGFGVFLWK